MLVSDFVYLNKNFKPIYDLAHENSEYWRQYISNDQFENLLLDVYSSLYSNQSKDKNSIWLHGTYGTGKSHAAGVIKKILLSNWSEIQGYVDDSIRSTELKSTIEKYSHNLPIFPIVLKGVSNVHNSFSFNMEIQTAVSKSLKLLNIEISTKDEFENFAQRIEQDKSNTWNLRLKEWDCLIEQGIVSKPELVQKLRNYDKSLIANLKKELEKERTTWAVPSITEWLSEIVLELKEKEISDKIVIFWDEFTSVMNLHNETIINQIQNLAELSQTKDVYLMLISHQTSNISKSMDERNSIRKMEDRFKKIHFEMMELTTFHLLENAIKISDKKLWEEKFKKYEDPLRIVINEIGSEYSKQLFNMFPLHPYTAYIANYIARQIGSTERSIFKFLYDSQNGFKFFIENSTDEREMLCTSDYIFRFFQEDFESSDQEQVKNILQKYTHSLNAVKSKKRNYVNLLQGLMLLNIAHRLLNTVNDHLKKIIPTKENLRLMFMGSNLEKEIDNFFEFINEKEIIPKDYEGRYLVESSVLDSQKINQQKDILIKKYNTALDMISAEQEKSIYNLILESTIFRRKETCKIQLIDSNASVTEILQKVKILNKEPKFTFKLVLAITNNLNHCEKFINTIRSFSNDSRINDIKTIVFGVIEKELFDSKDITKFIDLKAKQEVAQKTKAIQEELNYSIQVEEYVNKLIVNYKADAQVTWFLFDESDSFVIDKSTFNTFDKVLDKDISKKIFFKSFDLMPDKLGIANIWKRRTSSKLLLHYLTSSSLSELNNNVDGQDAPTKNILETEDGTRIVKDNMKFLRPFPSHPLYIIKENLQSRLVKGKILNFADILSFLFKPPFGVYNSMVFFAAIGYCFQPYVGKIYLDDSGLKCSVQNLADLIIKAFKYHCDSNKRNKDTLNFRLGSDEEDKLKNEINEIFNLIETDSLQQTKHQLLNWFKENHNYPLWIYNNIDDIDEDVLDILEILQCKILLSDLQLEPIKPPDMKAIYEELVEQKEAMKELFHNVDQTIIGNYYKEFIVKNLRNSYSDDIIYEIMDNLERSSQGDRVFMEIEKAKELLTKWEIDYVLKLSKSSNKPKDDHTNQVSGNIENPNKKLGEQQIDHLEELIRKFPQKTQNVFITLIKRQPDIKFILLDILKEEI